MEISEECLKEIILRVLHDFEEEKKLSGIQKVYMICTSQWDERYCDFLKLMEKFDNIQIYVVVHELWIGKEYERILKSYKSCYKTISQSCELPKDLDKAVTVFPVVPKDIVVKSALCISDTFETSWITSCIENGGRIIFLRNGLMKFSGKESKVYISQILSYYRKILEYGIEISDINEIKEKAKNETLNKQYIMKEKYVLPSKAIRNEKRVITASNIEHYAEDGIVHINKNDIVTDLARDKAKFLNIIFKYAI